MGAASYDRLPSSMKALPQWIIWQYGQRNGKTTKVPKSPKAGQTADAQDPANWVPFTEAVAAARRFKAAGIGFVVTEKDTIVGGDLDHCRNKQTGEIASWAKRIIDRMQTYTEITPSGEGLRFFALGKLPAGRRKTGNIELYDAGRFLTCTGQHLADTPPEVCERTGELAALHAKVFKTGEQAPQTDPTLSDDALLDKARHARNGDKFAALYDRGDTSAYRGDDSAADLALCGMLAFWTGEMRPG